MKDGRIPSETCEKCRQPEWNRWNVCYANVTSRENWISVNIASKDPNYISFVRFLFVIFFLSFSLLFLLLFAHSLWLCALKWIINIFRVSSCLLFFFAPFCLPTTGMPSAVCSGLKQMLLFLFAYRYARFFFVFFFCLATFAFILARFLICSLVPLTLIVIYYLMISIWDRFCYSWTMLFYAEWTLRILPFVFLPLASLDFFLAAQFCLPERSVSIYLRLNGVMRVCVCVCVIHTLHI